MSEPSERTALYRLYDADDRLLYVGIAGNPKARWRRHAAEKAWWADVAIREVEWFESREKAGLAEVEIIRTERPVHNRAHNPSPTELLALLPVAQEKPLRPRLRRVERDERPAAQQAAADLRALIMSGDAPIGSRLPTTAEFIEQYRISNVTVQRALGVLKDEGFAVGKAGSGVYVTSPTPEGIDDPAAHQTVTISIGEAPAPKQVATALGLDSPEMAWREKTVAKVGGWPFRLTTAYRRSQEPPTRVTAYVDRLTVRLPTSSELMALNLPDEVPVLCTFRTAQGEAGAALEIQIITEPGHLCQRQYTAPVSDPE